MKSISLEPFKCGRLDRGLLRGSVSTTLCDKRFHQLTPDARACSPGIPVPFRQPLTVPPQRHTCTNLADIDPAPAAGQRARLIALRRPELHFDRLILPDFAVIPPNVRVPDVVEVLAVPQTVSVAQRGALEVVEDWLRCEDVVEVMF